MRVLGGKWSKILPAKIKRTFTRKPRAISIHRHFFAPAEEIPLDQIETIQIVTEQKNKDGAQAAVAGLAGGLVLGGVGALAGVLSAGNSKALTVAIKFKDGRGVLLECKPSEFEAIYSGHFFE